MAFNCNLVSSNAVPEEEIERSLSRACTAEQDLSSLALEADHDAHEGHFTGGKFRWAMRSAAANDFYLRTSFREIVRASAGLPTEQRLIAYDACDEHEVKAPLGLFRKRLDARRNTKPKKPDAQLLVCTPFDPSAFNFTKIKDPREKILTPLLLNNAPYEILTNKFPLFAGHMLLVSKLPVAQQMTSAHLGAIAELLQSCSMSAYFNSWCASASVNHFHCHLIDEVPPVAALPLVRGPLVRGVRCLQPEGFPGFCYVFRIRDVWLLADLVRAMQEDNQVGAPSARHHSERPPFPHPSRPLSLTLLLPPPQPHNLVFARGHVYVFPKPLVRPQRSFELYPETVGGPELAGSFTVYRDDDYEALSAAAGDELFRLNTAPLPSRLLHRGSPPLAATAARTDDTAVGCGNSGAATATYAGALSARLLPMKACQSMDTLPSAMPGCLVYC